MVDSTLEKIKQFSDDQFSNENRLKARIQIYEFCEQKINWHQWVFDRLNFSNVARILELGCGNGQLWANNTHRLPENINIVLTDVSEGMVDAARKELSEYDNRFEFRVTDASETPFEDNRFQMIIANHMLNLIEDKEQVFSEIERLLADNGYVYASTLSTMNFHELFNIAGEFDKNMELDSTELIKSFNLENGEEVISRYFNVENSYIYQNDVIVKNTEPLILYLASCYAMEQLAILIDSINDFREFLDSIIRETGEIRITNKTVLFKFRKK